MNEQYPDVVVVDPVDQVADPDFAAAAHHILASLVRSGAALGWVEPPGPAEVAALLRSVARAAAAGNGALRAAYAVGQPAGAPARVPADQMIGLGYWTRYERPTHRPHADVRRIAVAEHAQGRGAGRALTLSLIEAARTAGIEVLTLDARGDNTRALGLYADLGFTEYGRLRDFVAVGSRRYDMVLCALDLRR